jgi:competence protein ComEC
VRLFPFGFFIGVLALLAAPTLPPLWIALLLAALAFSAFAVRKRFAAAVTLCGLCCGGLFAGYHADRYLDARWPERLSDERVIASVVIDSIPAPRDTGWAFDAEVEVESPQTLVRTLRVRLMSRDPSFRPVAGERWRLLLSLRPPQGHANPGTQDMARQLFRDEVHALGTVVPATLNRRVDDGHRPLTSLRERISRHIESQVADRDAAALLAALAVGDTGRVSREQWRVFNATGTTHLVAISGMHVTLFAVIAFAVARWLWSACAIQRWPRETFASVLGFGAAAGYATLAGLSVPTQRTLIMLGTWLLARSLARVTAPLQPLGLALLAVLLLDPFAPLSAGFWLSFVAMAAIIAVTSGHILARSMLREAIAAQAAVTVALIPFTLALFGTVSIVGPLVNIAAIPAMSWVLVPTVLLSVALMPISTFCADRVLRLAAWLHDAGWPWLAAASDVPWALFHASPPWWWYVLATFAVLMALLPWPLRMRVAALFCVVPLTFTSDSVLEQGEAEVTVLDVGESSAIVVRTATHVLVFGTGDGYGTHGRTAENIVVPFLRSRGVRAVDVLMVGQASPAAGEGVTALLAEMPVHQTFVDCVEATGARVWDGIPIVVGPDAAHACLISVSAARARVLIPGPGFKAALFAEDGTRRWAVVSGRRTGRLARKPVPAGWLDDDVNVLATAEAGALQLRIDAARGITGPTARREDRRTLWGASP